MLTLAIPVGVVTSNAGGNAIVSAELAQPNTGSATNNGRIDKIRITVLHSYLVIDNWVPGADRQ
jgi:hypothetical protein